MRRLTYLLPLLSVPFAFAHCGSPCGGDAGCAKPADAAFALDSARPLDAANVDAMGSSDAQASTDAAADGGQPSDAATGADDAATDTGATDAGLLDSAPADAANADAGAGDTGAANADAGAGDAGRDAGGGALGACVSGAVGNYAARFRWAGNGANSRAYVQYEANNFPDAARWRAGAYSRGGIGYNPVFSDTFLGVGGLDMGSTTFMDVELSTARFATIRRVTLAIFGRSFNTVSSGSFAWLTFDGNGATPSGAVSNVAPYRWYAGDATAAFRAGNAGVLLRISSGGPSSALVVSRVEVCIDGDP